MTPPHPWGLTKARQVQVHSSRARLTAAATYEAVRIGVSAVLKSERSTMLYRIEGDHDNVPPTRHLKIDIEGGVHAFDLSIYVE